MVRFAYLAAFASAFAAYALFGTAAAGPADRSVMPGTTKLAADWDDRICCHRGDRNWWSTPRDCRDARGDETDRRECREARHDDDWYDRWDQRWRNWPGDWDQRVCCMKDGRDWWSRARECRERGGWIARDRECRDDRHDNDWDDRWDQRWRNWEGDWDRRVCCLKDGRDWWSTARECRRTGGWMVRDRECR